MLWTAGQDRIAREARERLAELYVGVRDGYVAGNVATGRARWQGSAHVPPYMDQGPRRIDSAGQRATLARLARLFPGAVVRRGDS